WCSVFVLLIWRLASSLSVPQAHNHVLRSSPPLSFKAPSTPAIYTLSLHDALPIFSFVGCLKRRTVDSWVWDCALLVPSKTIAITRPTENICGNSTCLKTPEQNVMGWKAKIATSCRNAFMTNILLARG